MPPFEGGVSSFSSSCVDSGCCESIVDGVIQSQMSGDGDEGSFVARMSRRKQSPMTIDGTLDRRAGMTARCFDALGGRGDLGGDGGADDVDRGRQAAKDARPGRSTKNRSYHRWGRKCQRLLMPQL